MAAPEGQRSGVAGAHNRPGRSRIACTLAPGTHGTDGPAPLSLRSGSPPYINGSHCDSPSARANAPVNVHLHIWYLVDSIYVARKWVCVIVAHSEAQTVYGSDTKWACERQPVDAVKSCYIYVLWGAV
jgi:hypothetical protein